MAKIAKHSTIVESPAKSQSYQFDEYYSLKDMRMQPAGEMFIAKLSHQLVEWSLKDDSFMISDFYNDLRISSECFYRWIKKHDNLKKAHQFAKEKIASRLFKGGLAKNYSESLVAKSMPIYSDVYKESEEWRAKIGERVDGATHINVTMTPFPNSEKVARRTPHSPLEDDASKPE